MVNKPITILYLIDTHMPLPDEPSPGGAETQLRLLAMSLDPKRFRPFVIGLDPRIPARRERIGDVEIMSLPTASFYGPQSFHRLVQMWSIAKNEKIDIIHTFFEKSEIMGWWVKRLARIPVWITSRRDLGFNRKKIYKKFFSYSSGDCAKCVANCEAVKARMIADEGISPEKVTVIYNGIDFDRSDMSSNGSLRKEIGISNDVPLVGMIANMIFEIKGHRYFLEAAKKVVSRLPNAEFVLVGDGRLRNKFEDMAKSFGIEQKIHFLGRRSDIHNILEDLTVSVLCSTSEGLSNVILESMAVGKPVVASRVGGNTELVTDGVTGILVLPADTDALADATISLLGNPDQAVAMGAEGRRIAQEKFSINAMVKNHETLYKELIQRRR